MDKEKNEKLRERVRSKLNDFPDYVARYILYKRANSSPVTLLNYLQDFYLFFDWLLEQGFFSGNRTEIPLLVLEKLKLEDVLIYQDYIQSTHKFSSAKRMISSVKDLFHYLSQIAEDDNFYPLLKRNVMAKVRLAKEKIDMNKKKQVMETKILRKTPEKDEILDFIHFVGNGYGEKIRNQKRLYLYYEKNKERDLAIFTLYLESGLRLSELTGLNVDDLDIEKKTLTILGKGNKEAVVHFGKLAQNALKEYMSIRENRYELGKDFKPLFVSGTMKTGTPERISERNVQRLMKKYASEYGKGKLTVHGLRHSFGTAFYEKYQDLVLTKDALRHENTTTTEIYTNLSSDRLKDAIERVNEA